MAKIEQKKCAHPACRCAVPADQKCAANAAKTREGKLRYRVTAHTQGVRLLSKAPHWIGARTPRSDRNVEFA